MNPILQRYLPLKAAFLLCFVSLFWTFNAKAGLDIDSLRIAYDYSENPHERVLIQIQIADEYYNKYSIDTAIFEYRKAIGIMHPDSLDLKGKTLNRLANAYRKVENMQEVKNTHFSSLDLFRKTKNYRQEAKTLSLIGRAYYVEASYDTAMTYYMDAKALYEKNNIVNEDYGFLLHFIGSVHKRQGDDDMACEYYHQEIEYGKENNMPVIEAEGIYLSGICYDPPEALEKYKEALRIYEELEQSRQVSLMYTLISGSYKSLGQLDSALIYQEKCLVLYREHKEISHLAAALSGIAEIQIELGRYAEAIKNLEEAEEIAAVTEIKQYIRYKDIYRAYFDLYYRQKNYREAVEYQSLWYIYKDSAQNQEHQDAIVEMEKFYNQSKLQDSLAIANKENELKAIENEKLSQEKDSETFIKYISFSAVGIVLLLGFFVWRKYKESEKQKVLITEQKREMQFQKELVEEKNKDITDSMIYASSIQKAIITSEDYIRDMFNDFFVFYQPRDIVSGDFYWAYQSKDGKKMIAVGDCTGHGVPGAMMSMLGTAFLNEIVIEGKNFSPADVLNKLRVQVKRALQDEDRKDGMDISICCIDGDKLTFAGANLPMYLLRSGVLREIKGNKQPVGYVPHEEEQFTEKEIEIMTNDQVYLFSDGYADQFGGEKGKKYKYKTFRERIVTLSGLAFRQQRNIIVSEFEQWKGDYEQLDDVCVLGVKI